MVHRTTRGLAIVVFFCALCLGGCVRQIIVNNAADALAGGGVGGGVFASDDDPQLIAESIPFGLKTMESLLQETPEHRGLLVALAAGFTQYAQGFVLPRSRDASFREAEKIEKRARKLHLRGHRYAVAALEVDLPGFTEQFNADPQKAVAQLSKDNIDAMYWCGASLGAAISISATDMKLVAELPKVDAMMQHALKLDPDWGEGAIHEFFISYEGRSEALGGSPERAQQHFARAVELTGGQKASPYLALASAVAIKKQDREMFNTLVQRALDIDPEAEPKYRLVNTIDRERALWMRDHIDDFIL